MPLRLDPSTKRKTLAAAQPTDEILHPPTPKYTNLLPHDRAVRDDYAFDAMVGLTIDEDSSYSRWLNNEGERERAAYVEQLVDEGVIDAAQYILPDGSLDYDRMRRVTGDDRIPTSEEIRRNKQDLLDKRRNMALNDLQLGGTQSALAGGLVAGGIDPINVASMLVAAPIASIKGAVTAAQAARRVAGFEAAVGAVSEIPIQFMVADYKEHLGREYGAGDVFTAIAGAAALSGAVGGIAGYLGRLARGPGDVADKAVEAHVRHELEAMEADLLSNPARLSFPEFKTMLSDLSVKPSRELAKIAKDEPDVLRRSLARSLVRERGAVSAVPARTMEVEAEGAPTVGPFDPRRVRDLNDPSVKADFVEYQKGVVRELEEVREAINALEAPVAKPRGKKAAAKAKQEATTRAKQAKRLRQEEAKLQEQLDTLQKRIEESKPLDPEATARAQEREDARVNRLYEDALIEADISWFRRKASAYNRLIQKRKGAYERPRTEAKASDQPEPDVENLINEEVAAARAADSADDAEASILLKATEMKEALLVARACRGVS